MLILLAPGPNPWNHQFAEPSPCGKVDPFPFVAIRTRKIAKRSSSRQDKLACNSATAQESQTPLFRSPKGELWLPDYGLNRRETNTAGLDNSSK